MAIDLITANVETIYQTLRKADMHPAAVELFIQLHDVNIQLQKATNELMDNQKKIIEALALINRGFGSYAERLKQIEKKYGDPHKDLIAAEKFDG